jgi:hypothetical protein
VAVAEAFAVAMGVAASAVVTVVEAFVAATEVIAVVTVEAASAVVTEVIAAVTVAGDMDAVTATEAVGGLASG